MMDHVLEMSKDQIIELCRKHGLPVVERKIQNIQTVVNFFNEIERDNPELQVRKAAEKISTLRIDSQDILKFSSLNPADPSPDSQQEQVVEIENKEEELSEDLRLILGLQN